MIAEIKKLRRRIHILKEENTKLQNLRQNIKSIE